MTITKESILDATNQGLDVFKHFVRGKWKVGKAFLNPFYRDTKASCFIYFDNKSRVYKIKDFGDATFGGDCFYFVGKIFNKDCSNSNDFREILQIVNKELYLDLADKNDRLYEIKKELKPLVKFANELEPAIPKANVSNQFKQPITKPFSDTEYQFWNQYGITAETLNLFGVLSIQEFEGVNKEDNIYKFTSSESEPIFGYPGKRYIKIYRPKSVCRFLYAGDLVDGYVFGLEQLPTRGDILFITGGEKDVMSLAANGFHAICFNSETATIPKNIIRRLNFRFKHITILYDCDKTGIDSAVKHSQALKDCGVKCLVLPLAGTKEEKDISDFFRMGYTRYKLMELFSEMLDKLYEETLSILKSCEIDFKNPPLKTEPLITINKVTVGSHGNLLCITGSEGSGKTNYLGGLISGVIRKEDEIIDTLGTEIKNNPEGKGLIIYDTEQSEEQLYKNLTFILKRANLDKPPTWLKAFCLVGMSRKERKQVIFQSMDRFYYMFKGIHMVVIDGIADLISSVNDEEQSVELVEELFRLAGIYKTCIVSVLHLSPSGLKLRGHLGSEIQRKAAGILSIEKEENSNSSVVKALKVRDGSPLDVPLIQFGWDKQLNRHIYLGEKSKEDVEARKVNDLYIIAKEIFNIKSVLNYQELSKAVMDALYVKERMAKNYIKYMKDHNIVEKIQGDSVEFRLIPKLF
jgi:hypothetical protein